MNIWDKANLWLLELPERLRGTPERIADTWEGVKVDVRFVVWFYKLGWMFSKDYPEEYEKGAPGAWEEWTWYFDEGLSPYEAMLKKEEDYQEGITR